MQATFLHPQMRAMWRCLLLTALFCLLGMDVWAAAPPLPDGTCTDNPIFSSMSGNNLITTVLGNLNSILTSITSYLYNSIISQSSFQALVGSLLSLYIVIYGLLFTLGLVEISAWDLSIRLVKLAIVSMLITGGSFGFFMYYLNGVLIQGGDQLISMMTSVGLGGVAGLSGSAPFAALDSMVENVTSAKMSVSMTGMMMTGAYGGLMFGLMLWGVAAVIRALLQAAWVYIMALCMLTLLMGTAPIFIACLLFSRTKYLFDGWLNQLVNAILQPVLLFTFFAFFAKLVEGTMNQIMATPWCWVAFDKVPGSGTTTHAWRPKINGTIERFKSWDFQGEDFTGMNMVFPISVIDVITFVLLSQLCGSLGQVVLQIAKSIAGASTNLNMSGMGQKVMEGFQQAAKGGKGGEGGGGGGAAEGAKAGAAANVGARANPGEK